MNIVQGSAEWFELRRGKVTASRVKDVIAKTKSGYSTSRANYRDELVKEMLGFMSDSYTSAAMQHGIDTESLARSLYEIKNDLIVKEIAFINHPSIKAAGMSPDGLVGDDGLIEIKCPLSTTHLNYILAGEVPERYKPQMAWQMACSGRKWVDFVSYDPSMEDGLEYFCIRYERDEKYIQYLEDEVIAFLDEVTERFKIVQQKLREIQHQSKDKK